MCSRGERCAPKYSGKSALLVQAFGIDFRRCPHSHAWHVTFIISHLSRFPWKKLENLDLVRGLVDSGLNRGSSQNQYEFLNFFAIISIKRFTNSQGKKLIVCSLKKTALNIPEICTNNNGGSCDREIRYENRGYIQWRKLRRMGRGQLITLRGNFVCIQKSLSATANSQRVVVLMEDYAGYFVLGENVSYTHYRITRKIFPDNRGPLAH